MHTIITVLVTALSILTAAPGEGETIICEVVPVEMYGMDDSDGASICANIVDHMDFSIIYDVELGDIMSVEFNEHDEVVAQEVIITNDVK